MLRSGLGMARYHGGGIPMDLEEERMAPEDHEGDRALDMGSSNGAFPSTRAQAKINQRRGKEERAVRRSCRRRDRKRSPESPDQSLRLQ